MCINVQTSVENCEFFCLNHCYDTSDVRSHAYSQPVWILHIHLQIKWSKSIEFSNCFRVFVHMPMQISLLGVIYRHLTCQVLPKLTPLAVISLLPDFLFMQSDNFMQIQMGFMRHWRILNNHSIQTITSTHEHYHTSVYLQSTFIARDLGNACG